MQRSIIIHSKIFRLVCSLSLKKLVSNKKKNKKKVVLINVYGSRDYTVAVHNFVLKISDTVIQHIINPF